MEKVFIDTSAWYSFLNQRDTDHKRILRILQRDDLKLVTTNFIVVETLNLLVSRRQKHIAIQFGKMLREGSEISIGYISTKEEIEAWKIFEKYADHDFSFTDCSSFAFMKRMKIQKAIALDNDFREAGFELIA